MHDQTRTFVLRHSRIIAFISFLFIGLVVVLCYFPFNPDEVMVWETTTYIPAFEKIEMRHLHPVRWPRKLVPPYALTPSDELAFKTRVALPKGSVLTQTVLFSTHQEATLSAMVPAQKVAISFAADAIHGVGGWIHPGDTIALFTSADLKPTHLLFPTLHVLSVDKALLGLPNTNVSMSSEENPRPMEESLPQVLTVPVTMPEAQVLIEAREQGRLTVVLKAVGDE